MTPKKQAYVRLVPAYQKPAYEEQYAEYKKTCPYGYSEKDYKCVKSVTQVRYLSEERARSIAWLRLQLLLLHSSCCYISCCYTYSIQELTAQIKKECPYGYKEKDYKCVKYVEQHLSVQIQRNCAYGYTVSSLL
jgi:hypothetical protein